MNITSPSQIYEVAIAQAGAQVPTSYIRTHIELQAELVISSPSYSPDQKKAINDFADSLLGIFALYDEPAN